MQLCGIELVQVNLFFSEEENGWMVIDALENFYRQLSQDALWRLRQFINRSPGGAEAIFTIEKKYEQQVKNFLKEVARKMKTELEFIEAPEKMVAENNLKVFPEI